MIKIDVNYDYSLPINTWTWDKTQIAGTEVNKR